MEGEKATHSFLGNCSQNDEVETRMGYGDMPGDDTSEAGRSRSVTLTLATHRIIWGMKKKTKTKTKLMPSAYSKPIKSESSGGRTKVVPVN